MEPYFTFSPAELSMRDKIQNTFHIPVELYFTLSPVELPKEINTVRNTFHIPVELYSMLSPPVFSNRDNYRKLKIHSISLWKCIFTLPSGAFNN